MLADWHLDVLELVNTGAGGQWSSAIRANRGYSKFALTRVPPFATLRRPAARRRRTNRPLPCVIREGTRTMRLPIALLLLAGVVLTGCSNSESPAPQANANASTAAPGGDASHAAAVSASTFLRALANGDVQTATGRLTPLAAEQMAKTGKQFAFAAVDSADFRVTRVWQPQADEAAVEYHMKAAAGAETVEFDLCCFMKNIQGDWRLGGLAYDVGEDQQPVVVNYEASETPQPAANPAQTVDSGGPQRNSLQTAQSPGETQPR